MEWRVIGEPVCWARTDLGATRSPGFTPRPARANASASASRFGEYAMRSPGLLAVSGPDGQMTYGELDP